MITKLFSSRKTYLEKEHNVETVHQIYVSKKELLPSFLIMIIKAYFQQKSF